MAAHATRALLGMWKRVGNFRLHIDRREGRVSDPTPSEEQLGPGGSSRRSDRGSNGPRTRLGAQSRNSRSDIMEITTATSVFKPALEAGAMSFSTDTPRASSTSVTATTTWCHHCF